jgi:hypothetical protein
MYYYYYIPANPTVSDVTTADTPVSKSAIRLDECPDNITRVLYGEDERLLISWMDGLGDEIMETGLAAGDHFIRYRINGSVECYFNLSIQGQSLQSMDTLLLNIRKNLINRIICVYFCGLFCLADKNLPNTCDKDDIIILSSPDTGKGETTFNCKSGEVYNLQLPAGSYGLEYRDTVSSNNCSKSLRVVGMSVLCL